MNRREVLFGKRLIKPDYGNIFIQQIDNYLRCVFSDDQNLFMGYVVIKSYFSSNSKSG